MGRRSSPSNVPKLCHLRGSPQRIGSNLGPTTAKLGPKPCTMTQNKARRTNKIDLLQLPVTAEAAGSSPVVPTILFNYLSESGFGRNCPNCPIRPQRFPLSEERSF